MQLASIELHRIAIIGGGVTGIAAALELSKHPTVSFHLFESSDRLGGVLETDHVGDFLIERSADNFATLQPAALQTECIIDVHLKP
ncbi:MAG: NAD(P)-binding protein [Planctomycetota bacterium]